MIPNKLVSIIIPTYKRSDMLERAIESVLNQTYSSLEVIVVDDNNPDSKYRQETEKLMCKYKNNNKVIYIKHEKNMNGAAARNTGIRQSCGEYIAFLDDDDYFLPSKIAEQVSFLAEKSEYNGAYCGRIQKGKEIISSLEGDLSECILSLSFTPTTPSLLFRKSAVIDLNGFDESYVRHQDFEFLLRYFEKNKLGVIPKPLVVIGQNVGENEPHGDSLDAIKEAFLNQFKKDIERLEAKNKGFKKEVYVSHYAPVFWDHFKERNMSNAIKVYINNFKVAPFKFNIALLKHLSNYLMYRWDRARKLRNDK